MFQSLSTGVTGIQQFQQQMDVIGNNITNVNTLAYKSARVDFEDAFSQTLTGADANGGGLLQVGTGVATSDIRTLYTQGATTTTGVPSDLAIQGDGFFIVRDPATDAVYATRAGNFRTDGSGYLINNQGYRLQGFNDMNLSTRGDLQVDTAQRPATAAANATMVSYTINSQGQIRVRLSDNTEYSRGQVCLQQFTNPDALIKEGGSLYSGLDAAAPLGGDPRQVVAPKTGSPGVLKSGKLELSNVDLANEFSTMISTQRAFQASARIITTSDELLQEVVNLKR